LEERCGNNLFISSLGDRQKAASYLSKALDVELTIAKESALFLNEQQQKKYWNNFNLNLQGIQSFCSRSDEAITISSGIFDFYLEAQGSILNSKKQLLAAASSSQDATVQKAYRDFMRNGSILFAEENLPISDRHIDTDSLREDVQQLEARLTRLGAEKLNIETRATVDWKDIGAALEPGEVAVAFSHFKYRGLNGWTDSVIYIAYVMPYGATHPDFIQLFEEKELKGLLNRAEMDPNLIYGYDPDFDDDEYQGREIWNLVWGKLNNYIEGSHHIYFSTTGLLSELNLAALPDGLDEMYRPMLVNRDMIQMVHAGNVVEKKQNNLGILKGPIVAFGGLNYDIDDDEWLAETGDQKTGTRGSGYFATDSTRSGFKYLPYTLSEVESLAGMAEEHSIPIKVYTGNSGLEEQYRQLAGESSPQILHLATHAAFLEDAEMDTEVLGAEKYQYNAQKDPMYRSRLMLSGANRTLKGDAIPEGVLDGVLTAQDVSTILLPNTELVVLSACETGVGDYDASEGVYGLQRAFQAVGIDNLVMTLFEINDAATSVFMQSFYEQLFEGKSYHEAMRITQIRMIESRYNQPVNWAGIILLQ